jgi:peptidoglycan hydrolase-like protein with peptidoglycan-binding domain
LPGEEVARTKQAEPQAAEKLPAAAVPGRKPGGSEPASRDQISVLLQEGQAPSARSRAARPAKADTASDKKVLAAQRALVKLGFVLNPDGIAGAATRQAVERYERERGLPVRGALSPEILRRLSAESGLPVN